MIHDRWMSHVGIMPPSQYAARPMAAATRVSRVGVIVSVKLSVKRMSAPIGQNRRTTSVQCDRSKSRPASVAFICALRTVALAKNATVAVAT